MNEGKENLVKLKGKNRVRSQKFEGKGETEGERIKDKVWEELSSLGLVKLDREREIDE